MALQRRAALTLLLVLALLPSCGGSEGDAQMPAGSLPRWEGDLRTLFDDEIDPVAVGMAMDGRSPGTDPMLRSRAQAAEIVARMRVQTLNSNTRGAANSYSVVLQIGQPPLLPLAYETDTVELIITPESGAYGMVQNLESKLQGWVFIGFVRRFAGVEGPELHWHLAADHAEVANIVKEIAVMEELAGQ